MWATTGMPASRAFVALYERGKVMVSEKGVRSVKSCRKRAVPSENTPFGKRSCADKNSSSQASARQ